MRELYLHWRPTLRIFCVLFLQQQKRKYSFTTRRRCWKLCTQSLGLVTAFLVASKCSFVSSADVLHSCSHGSQRTISECEGGVKTPQKKKTEIVSQPFSCVLVGLYTNQYSVRLGWGLHGSHRPRTAQIGADKRN